MSQSKETSTVYYAVAGIGAIALAGLVYYLSREDVQSLDPEKFTKERFETMMNEI